MSEITFFYSINDPSIVQEAQRLGNHLVVNKDYALLEELIIISPNSNVDDGSFNRFYILPSAQFASELSTSQLTKYDGRDFYYIKDRIGAAAIDLILYKKPSEGKVCVGSLGFQARTYPSVAEPLESRPPVFSDVFRSLRLFIKRSAQPVPNKLFPKTVYVFPQAMTLLREDFSRSPWPTIEIAD